MMAVLRSAYAEANHRANRLSVVADMATWLVASHARRLPAATHAEVVEAALACACGLTDGQWLELGERTGHYQTAGARPHGDTTAAVLAHLEALLPSPDPEAAFAGLPS